MFKKIYGLMDAEEKRDCSRILTVEVNAYLDRIYRGMKRNVPLRSARIRREDLVLKHASSGATKFYEFRLNPRDAVARGDVGKVYVVTRGLDDEAMRKQRALFIAAEFYTYHAFANHPDPKVFDSISGQNQYVDIFKRIFGISNPHDLRDHAIRYIIEEIGEHKLAHLRLKGWYVRIAKIKQHNSAISDVLGSSEVTFREILRKQHQSFSKDLLLQEDVLIKKEMEDISHLIKTLQDEKKSHGERFQKLADIHIKNLMTFKEILQKILINFDKWMMVEKSEHDVLRKRLHVPAHEIRALLQAEAEAERIDINKVHILFGFFKKEKINILMDLENFQ
jgi:hypothetical protein